MNYKSFAEVVLHDLGRILDLGRDSRLSSRKR